MATLTVSSTLLDENTTPDKALTEKGFMLCSRCGAKIKLPGCEEHRKICIPISDRYRYFVKNQSLACRVNSMTGESEYGCEHPIYLGSIRNVWEKQNVWHRDTEASRCGFFDRKTELQELMKVEVVMQWARQNRH